MTYQFFLLPILVWFICFQFVAQCPFGKNLPSDTTAWASWRVLPVPPWLDILWWSFWALFSNNYWLPPFSGCDFKFDWGGEFAFCKLHTRNPNLGILHWFYVSATITCRSDFRLWILYLGCSVWFGFSYSKFDEEPSWSPFQPTFCFAWIFSLKHHMGA